MQADRLHIITGAPGTGKTAILDSLEDGAQRFPEPARLVLARWRAAGNASPAQMEWTAFVAAMLRQSIEDHEAAIRMEGTAVFDRGVPDAVAYALHLGTDPAEAAGAAAQYRYASRVLITRPWADIYTTDDERTMTFDMVLQFDAALERAYRSAGYDLVEIPRGTVQERVSFVGAQIAG